jgi:hypothetical protein
VLRHPILLALLAIQPIPLAAQQADDLAAGVRVRVDERFVGTVFDLSRDTLVVHGADDDSSDVWWVSVDDIEKLEVSRGRKSNWKTGMWVGTLGGGAIGLLAGAAACEDSLFSKGECVAMSATAGMLVGIPLGTLLGALIKTERWVQVSVAPRGGGVTLGVSVPY